MDGIGGGGGSSIGSMGGGGGLGGGSSIGGSSPIEKPSKSESIDSGADRSSKSKTPTDSVKVGKGEGKNAAKQSDKMVSGLANLSLIKAPEKSAERTPEQVAREKELFNNMANRVTPGSEGSFMQGASGIQEDAQELFKPEAKAGRDGSAVQDRFNSYMEESNRDARMSASLSGKDKDLLDVTLSNPVAGKKETIFGGFSADELKK